MSSPIEGPAFRPFYQPRTFYPVSKRSWDRPIDHVSDKHAGTLKRLDLRAGYVRKLTMKCLFDKCCHLEELSVGTCRNSVSSSSFLVMRQNYLGFTRQFELRTLKKGAYGAIVTEDVSAILNGVTSLRRLIINDDEWEGSWALATTGGLCYNVKQLEPQRKNLWALPF